MSASSWANRLEAKLSSLTETSSKESIQTLAKWMGFNRKHASSFAQVLQTRLLLLLQDNDNTNNNNNIINMTEKLQVTYINVIHEVMLLEQHNTAKWDKLSELRCALGENVILQLAKQNAWSNMAKEKLLVTTSAASGGGGGGGFLKIWDTSNVFGGPTLISQIRKELSSPSSSSSSPNKTAADEKPTPPPATAEAKLSPTSAAAPAAAAAEEEAPLKQEEEEEEATEESPSKEGEEPKATAAQAIAAAADASETLPAKEEDTTTTSTAVTSEPVVKNEKENKSNSRLKTPPLDVQEESAMKKVRTKPPEKAAVALQEEESVDSLLSSKPAAATTTVKTVSSSPSSPPQEQADDETAMLFDFHATGVSEEKVNPKEFLEPCRAIATLQIARDLRSDGAVQLSSLLSGLPTDVRKACAASAEQGENGYNAEVEIPEEQARDFSIQVEDGIVDLDLEEELRNIRTFREIVQRQGEARQKLYTLLTKSKCNFGADEAAAAMYQADKARFELRKRKRILVDAMELEGLDVPEEKNKTTLEQEKLVPLPWYTPPPPDEDNDDNADVGES